MPNPFPAAAVRADRTAPFAPLEPAPGRVFWITGLAGAGKSALGSRLYERLKALGAAVVLPRRRRTAANDRARPRLHSRRTPGIGAPQRAAVPLDLGPGHRRDLRHDLDVPRMSRMEPRPYAALLRDLSAGAYGGVDRARPENLYSRALAGEVSNVTGLDLGMDEPDAADAVIDNDGDLGLDEIVECVMVRIERWDRR